MTGGVIGVVGYLALFAHRHWTWRRTVATLAVLLAVCAALVVWYPRAAAHATSHNAWVIRQQLAKVGFQMVREAPLFGIGVGRFFEESARLATPELRQYYSAQNAHNQFIQFLGELGIVGAGLFVAVIGCSVIPGWRRAEPLSSAVVIHPMIAGLVGFLVASLLMHPLLLPEVAAAFWLALGVARSTVVASAIDHKPAGATVLAPALVALALVASLPARTTATRNAVDLSGAAIGLSTWRSDRDGRRFRSAAGDATIFVDSRQRRLRVPLRVRGRRGTQVDLRLLLDGRPAGRMLVPAGRWTEMTLLLPAHRHDRPNFRRLELNWSAVTSRARLHVGQVEYPGRRAP